MTSSPSESADAFQFGRVLHNLSLPDGLSFSHDAEAGSLRLPGVSDFELVPGSHPRLERLADAARIGALLAAFRTADGHPYRPAVLLVPRVQTFAIEERFQRMYDWRNAIAIARLLAARAMAIGEVNAVHPYWSDVFEVHPTTPSDSGGFITDGQGVLSKTFSNATLNLSHSPHLSPRAIAMCCDNYLERALGKAYVVAHGSAEPAWGRTVFRSLELAMAAASVRAVNAASLVDIGTTLTLWVSALEVLAWPKDNYAGRGEVHKLLGAYQWPSEELRSSKYTWTVEGKGKKGSSFSGNLCQFLASALYDARNAFAHGRPISHDTLLAKGPDFAVSLLETAPIVFRAALVAYLAPNVPLSLPGADEWENDQRSYDELFEGHLWYATALERAVAESKKAAPEA